MEETQATPQTTTQKSSFILPPHSKYSYYTTKKGMGKFKFFA